MSKLLESGLMRQPAKLENAAENKQRRHSFSETKKVEDTMTGQRERHDSEGIDEIFKPKESLKNEVISAINEIIDKKINKLRKKKIEDKINIERFFDKLFDE